MRLSAAPYRLHFFVALLVMASSAACRDATGPDRYLVPLSAFDVPSAASARDTIRIAFSYAIDCGRVPVLETRAEQTQVTVAAWIDSPATGGFNAPCPEPTVQRAELRLLPVAQRSTVTVTFRQPGGVDSVRVIEASGATRSAP
jgi:hypothetical protein